ncbi:hypothetical protein LCGC14_0983870 [marine sediment metagenome]|uniref:Uncharacterized protein n=2 Tax=marine sediment metagenome TaxID=412755 RepID=A0A0F9QR53_9ZZZZ
MTAFNARKSNRTPKGRNKKDGNGPLARQRDYNKRLEALGFTRTGWNKWSYSWQGDFPTFTLAPGGLLNGETGLIAKFEEIEILFPYGTKPADIKDRLDDEILGIVEGQGIGLAKRIGKLILRRSTQIVRANEDWLTENLPETNRPASTRPGAEYGVDV